MIFDELVVIETVAETVAADLAYAEYMDTILWLGTGIYGFLLFFVIVVLCYFVYKFFRIFF